VVALLASGLGLSVGGGAPDPGAPPGGGVTGLPDHLGAPGPRTPGTDDAGPPGPAAAVVGAPRGTWPWARTDELASVSAQGDYRFLDLPDRARGASFFTGGSALSPDGRSVAYLLTGQAPDGPGDLTGDLVVGLAVYDLVDGDVTRLAVDSEHGIEVEAMTWTADRLWVAYGAWDSRVYPEPGVAARSSTISEVRTIGWDPETGDVVDDPEVDSSEMFRGGGLGAGGPAGEALSVTAGRTVWVLDADTGSLLRRVRLDRPARGPVRVSDDGGTLAWRVLDEGVHNEAAPVRVRAPDGVSRDLPGVEAIAVVGWRDSRHLVVQRSSGSFASVDVRTGRPRTLVAADLPPFEPGVDLAADALRAEVVAAADPPGDPWWWVALLAGAGGCLLLALAVPVLVLARRGRRADRA